MLRVLLFPFIVLFWPDIYIVLFHSSRQIRFHRHKILFTTNKSTAYFPQQVICNNIIHMERIISTRKQITSAPYKCLWISLHFPRQVAQTTPDEDGAMSYCLQASKQAQECKAHVCSRVFCTIVKIFACTIARIFYKICCCSVQYNPARGIRM